MKKRYFTLIFCLMIFMVGCGTTSGDLLSSSTQSGTLEGEEYSLSSDEVVNDALYVYDSSKEVEGATYGGTMEHFWKYHPVTGEYAGSGNQLQYVPEYIYDNDWELGYERRTDADGNAYDMEIPFKDGMSMPRFLGGYSTRGNNYMSYSGTAVQLLDPVYRNDFGNIEYRMSVIKERLDPYVTRGYTDITLVLDNIPWALAEENVEDESYGQTAIPDDMQEWYEMIREICLELVDLYGYDIVSQFRFRLGTELGSGERFDTDQMGFHMMYDYMCAAIRSVLPNVAMGLWNNAGSDGTINYPAYFQYCESGGNYALGDSVDSYGSDWIAFSTYGIVSPELDSDSNYTGQASNLSALSPATRSAALIKSYETYSDVYGKEVPFEIHEYGFQYTDEYGINGGAEEGARGAAIDMQYLLQLREGGLSRSYSWRGMETVNQGINIYNTVLQSQGWVYSIFNEIEGTDMYNLNYTASATSSDYSSGENIAYAFTGTDDGSMYVVLSSLNVQRDQRSNVTFNVTIPKTLGSYAGEANAISYNEDNDLYLAIRNYLYENDGLSESIKESNGITLYAPDLGIDTKYVASLSTMIKDNTSKTLFATGSDLHNDIIVPYTESLLSYTSLDSDYNYSFVDNGDDYTLKITIDTPETILLKIA